jgi:hypothetical protein
MSYATLDDVQRRMPQFQLTLTSKPTSDTAQVFIDDTTVQFDAIAENLGYVTPVTGVKSIGLAREIISQGSIAKILYARASAIGTDVAVASADRAQKMFDDWIRALADPKNPLEMTDCPRTGSTVDKPANTLDGLIVDDDGNEIQPRICMDSRF